MTEAFSTLYPCVLAATTIGGRQLLQCGDGLDAIVYSMHGPPIVHFKYSPAQVV